MTVLAKAVSVVGTNFGGLECLGCLLVPERSKIFYEPVSFEKHLLKHRALGDAVHPATWSRAKRWRSNAIPERELGNPG